jgi:hypothetical protein
MQSKVTIRSTIFIKLCNAGTILSLNITDVLKGVPRFPDLFTLIKYVYGTVMQMHDRNK